MINKIIWVSFGPDVSEVELDYAIYIAKAFGSKIYSLYIKPTTYHREKHCSLTEEERKKNIEWNNYRYKQNLKIIENFHNKIRDEQIDFSYTILEGVLCLEILNFAKDRSADLIVIDKGKIFKDKCTVQKTTLYVIRHSPIPVFSTNQSVETKKIKTVLVPTDIYNIDSEAFDLADKFAGTLHSRITHFNIQKKHAPEIPAELKERMHGDAYFKLRKPGSANKNIRSVVLDSPGIADGIIEYTNNHKIDMIILQTYCGEKEEIFHSNGSVAEKTLQQVKCPVITIKTKEEENYYGK